MQVLRKTLLWTERRHRSIGVSFPVYSYVPVVCRLLSFTLRRLCWLVAVLENVLTQLRQKSKELDQDRCMENPLGLVCVRHIRSAFVSLNDTNRVLAAGYTKLLVAHTAENMMSI